MVKKKEKGGRNLPVAQETLSLEVGLFFPHGRHCCQSFIIKIIIRGIVWNDSNDVIDARDD
jgi:hypothetical protein